MSPKTTQLKNLSDDPWKISEIEKLSTMAELKYDFPQTLVDYFATMALKNFDNEGQIETLGLALGTKVDNVIHIEELVIPSQIGSSCSVVDNGKYMLLQI